MNPTTDIFEKRFSALEKWRSRSRNSSGNECYFYAIAMLAEAGDIL